MSITCRPQLWQSLTHAICEGVIIYQVNQGDYGQLLLPAS